MGHPLDFRFRFDSNNNTVFHKWIITCTYCTIVNILYCTADYPKFSFHSKRESQVIVHQWQQTPRYYYWNSLTHSCHSGTVCWLIQCLGVHLDHHTTRFSNTVYHHTNRISAQVVVVFPRLDLLLCFCCTFSPRCTYELRGKREHWLTQHNPTTGRTLLRTHSQ